MRYDSEIAEYRGQRGMAARAVPLLTPPTSNVKLGKDGGVVTYGLALAPHRTSGVLNVCPWSTPACRVGCVALHGRGLYSSVQAGRAWKTALLADDRPLFEARLGVEIAAAYRKHGDALRVRLNTFSDVDWTRFVSATEREHVRLYDYTKNLRRRGTDNYRLTYSVTPERHTVDTVREVVARGDNVAMVFPIGKRQELPLWWDDIAVIDGDKSDDRTADPYGVIVGLRAKGAMCEGSSIAGAATARRFVWNLS